MALEFSKVYDDEVWSVFGFFSYRLGSREEAEDLTQQTFERALRAWPRFDPGRARPRTWLLSIARNLLVDHLRRAGRSAEVTIEHDRLEHISHDRAPSPEESIGGWPELAAALGGLGQREREVLALRYGGDLAGPEIARLLDLTLANVQQILSRSLRRLRAELEAAAQESRAAVAASRQR